MVTHVGIIHKGNLLFQGTLEDLHVKQSLTSSIRFETSDIDKSFEVLSKFGLSPVNEDAGILIPVVQNELIAEINRGFVNQGIDVYRISTIKNDLESIFMEMVK